MLTKLAEPIWAARPKDVRQTDESARKALGTFLIEQGLVADEAALKDLRIMTMHRAGPINLKSIQTLDTARCYMVSIDGRKLQFDIRTTALAITLDPYVVDPDPEEE